MTYVGSITSSRSAFEQFILETFGIYINFSTNAMIVFVVALVVVMPFLVSYMSEKTIR